jgi:hypothetical protein
MSTSESSGTLDVVTRSDDDFSRGDRLTLISKPLNVDLLRQGFEDFMSKLQSIVQAGHEQAGPFRLDQIEFSAEITADGEFKLLGTGVGLEAKTGVTFVLKRSGG